jgi:hypothetical protein
MPECRPRKCASGPAGRPTFAAQYPPEAAFPLKAGVAATLLELDQRSIAGEGRRPGNVNRVLPINFCGGPDEIVAQLQKARASMPIET